MSRLNDAHATLIVRLDAAKQDLLAAIAAAHETDAELSAALARATALETEIVGLNARIKDLEANQLDEPPVAPVPAPVAPAPSPPPPAPEPGPQIKTIWRAETVNFIPGKSSWPNAGANNARNVIGKAPDGKTCVVSNIKKGSNDVSQVIRTFRQFDPAVRRARAAFDLWVPPEFKWSERSVKLPVGIFGGPADGVWPLRISGGGMTFEPAGGFSARLLCNQDKLVLGKEPPPPGGAAGGEWFGSGYALTRGRWQRIEIEVALNTLGKADGEAALYAGGAEVRRWTGLDWRGSKEWVFWNLIASDMWGGDISSPTQMSPQDQTLYCRDWELKAVS